MNRKVKGLKYLTLLSIFLLLPFSASAQVAKVIFITEPQSIPADTLSGPMTIQTVDSDGVEYKIPETFDLQFKSTSATGSFLSSSGNPTTDYMSKNTAKRTFYYKDPSSGTFTITLVATGRESGKEWSVAQDISVGERASSDSSSQSVSSSSTGSSGSGSSSSGSKTGANDSLEVSAGTDRVVSVGSPLDLQASVKKSSTGDGVKFTWSFGDGFVGTGAKVIHTYNYAGNYAVTLNARSGGNSVVHRIKVKVVEARISLSLGDGYIEISNDTQNDINLFNWKLVNAGKAFIFQPDTVILAGSKIKIPNSLLLMRGQAEGGTVLKNTLGQVVAAYNIAPSVAVAPVAQANYKPKVVEVSVAGTSTVANKSTSSPVIYEAPARRGFAARTFGFLAKLFK